MPTKTRPGAEANSNHVPVVGKFRMKLKKIQPDNNIKNTKLDLELLQ
jgi:hypothetical protein